MNAWFQFNCLKYPLTSGSYSKSDVTESVVNSINLLTIKENIAAYTSFEALLADVQWIIHNCMILFASKWIILLFSWCLKCQSWIAIQFVKSFFPDRQLWKTRSGSGHAHSYGRRNQKHTKMRWMLRECLSPFGLLVCDGLCRATSHHLG